MFTYKPALLEVYLRMERDIKMYDWALGQREIGQRYGNEGEVEHYTELVMSKEEDIRRDRKHFIRDVGIPTMLWGLDKGMSYRNPFEDNIIGKEDSNEYDDYDNDA